MPGSLLTIKVQVSRPESPEFLRRFTPTGNRIEHQCRPELRTTHWAILSQYHIISYNVLYFIPHNSLFINFASQYILLFHFCINFKVYFAILTNTIVHYFCWIASAPKVASMNFFMWTADHFFFINQPINVLHWSYISKWSARNSQ